MRELTYLIYILGYETLVLGGCGYVTFGLGHSNWWWVLAVVLSGSAYKPGKWMDGEDE
jgi:hypothetical protein